MRADGPEWRGRAAASAGGGPTNAGPVPGLGGAPGSALRALAGGRRARAGFASPRRVRATLGGREPVPGFRGGPGGPGGSTASGYYQRFRSGRDGPKRNPDTIATVGLGSSSPEKAPKTPMKLSGPNGRPSDSASAHEQPEEPPASHRLPRPSSNRPAPRTSCRPFRPTSALPAPPEEGSPHRRRIPAPPPPTRRLPRPGSARHRENPRRPLRRLRPRPSSRRPCRSRDRRPRLAHPHHRRPPSHRRRRPPRHYQAPPEPPAWPAPPTPAPPPAPPVPAPSTSACQFTKVVTLFGGNE